MQCSVRLNASPSRVPRAVFGGKGLQAHCRTALSGHKSSHAQSVFTLFIFGQYPSEPISLGGRVPNGSALNLGLQSLPPHHIG